MPVWKPPGNIEESPARWEANPDRSTFFLQCLVDAAREGKFRHTPTIAAYTHISKQFWTRYNIYHTPKQLRNYYSKCKRSWSTISWARGCTGIGWDDSQKMILASDEWWLENQGRKGLLLLKDRPIVDFELLQTIFARTRVEANYAYSPFQPIPLQSDEGSGDSDNPEETQFFDPLLQLPSRGEPSLSTTSTQKRMADAVGNRKGKHKKKKGNNEESMSPLTTSVTRAFTVLLDMKEKRRRIAFEAEGISLPTSIGGQMPITQPSSLGGQVAIASRSVTINSPSNMEKCMTIITEVLKVPQTSELFEYGTDLLIESPDSQALFLYINDPHRKLAWLQRKVLERYPNLAGRMTPITGYDLNHPPREGDV